MGRHFRPTLTWAAILGLPFCGPLLETHYLVDEDKVALVMAHHRLPRWTDGAAAAAAAAILLPYAPRTICCTSSSYPCRSSPEKSSIVLVQDRRAMAAAPIHCARAGVPSMTFEYCVGSSSRITFSYYKYCATLESHLHQNKFQDHSRLIQYRVFILPRSSLEKRACEHLVHGMDEQWTDHSSYSQPFSSAQPSTQKRDVKKLLQDHSSCQPSTPQGDVYTTGLSMKEIERRRKIGAANKGKVPWTKGRKLSKEHKELIKQRTTEALRDPKVRKKMLGHRQLHRQASKDKISAALRKIWERRIVSVKARQEVIRTWSNNIAAAAKQGDYWQDKLDWDSYDRIKSEMISTFLWNKVREKIIKKLNRAEAKIVAKKLQAAERSKLQSRGINKLQREKLVLRKSDAELTRVVVSTRPKLKERLTKWHDRKKELETMIHSRKRKGVGLRSSIPRRKAAERRAEVDLVEEVCITCKDRLPCEIHHQGETQPTELFGE